MTNNFSKEKMYLINGRRGQFELITSDRHYCFFMDDTMKYEYFSDNVTIEECKND